MADRINERREPWPWRETIELTLLTVASGIGLLSLWYTGYAALAVVAFGECLQQNCDMPSAVSAFGRIIGYAGYASLAMVIAKVSAEVAKTVERK